MIDSLLIANRGEIACRIIRTAHRMGIRTIAVHSDADMNALHVKLADEAVHIGPSPARESYLVADRIIEAARLTGADAIHPGYGFLSENAEFADACKKAGIIFVGPPADAIRAMGSKSEAKARMEKAGVPLVPGYHGKAQDDALLKAEADRIGYPVLIKASAGGGGKGMRRVDKASDFLEALASCRREASASFGDDHVLVERYVTRPRHIEMQVFADSHGNAVHLFERDCSIQRRHQKVIEEAPAPGMTEDMRKAMGEAAVSAALAIGYQGAGTIEFIADTNPDGTPAAFYFMEMNTRLQVEHPVTEMITGQDLVEWQLRVASGEPLPLTQGEITCTGHAMEARLYAEDPESGFLPATGRLRRLRFPDEADGIRIDSGVVEGDEISVHYDPMIAKVIVHGSDRLEASRLLHSALQNTRVVGLATNRDFLAAIAGNANFRQADLDTGFIERVGEAILPVKSPAPDEHLILAALAEALNRREHAEDAALDSLDPWSPWAEGNGWRLNDNGFAEFRYNDGVEERTVRVTYLKDRFDIRLDDGASCPADAIRLEDGSLSAVVAGHRITAFAERNGTDVTVVTQKRTSRLTFADPMAAAALDEGAADRLAAPMPGKVTAVFVKDGERVSAGQALMVLEAMKMEHTIKAPADGIVAEVRFAPGDQVGEGEELAVFDAAED